MIKKIKNIFVTALVFFIVILGLANGDDNQPLEKTQTVRTVQETLSYQEEDIEESKNTDSSIEAEEASLADQEKEDIEESNNTDSSIKIGKETSKVVIATSKAATETSKATTETSKAVAETTKAVTETSKTVVETSKTVAETSNTVTETSKTVTETSIKAKPVESSKVYYEVEKVVDGDTIRIYKDGQVERIRLLLIDTPESVHSEQYKNVAIGTVASNFTKDFLAGHKVYLEYDQELQDRYGRTLAYVYREDGQSLNKALLYASVAKVPLYQPNDKHYEEYKAIEREVRPKGKGIWADIEAAYPGKPKEVKQQEQQNKSTQTTSTTKQISNTESSSQKPLIKGNINREGEKIYHIPGQRDYDKTIIDTSKGERWFYSEEEAVAAGWRRAKR